MSDQPRSEGSLAGRAAGAATAAASRQAGPSPAEAADEVRPRSERHGLVATGLTKQFRRRKVVDGVSLEISPGEVVGLLGPNGIGKSTAFQILSGTLVPNLGNIVDKPSWEPVLERYAGTELHDFLERVAEGQLRTAMKPQYVDRLPKVFKGKVRKLLSQVDERGNTDEVVDELGIGPVLDQDLETISGGELQHLAIAATIVAVADSFDAMTHDRPYRKRRSGAQAVREIAACSGTQFSPKVVAALARLHKRHALPRKPTGTSEQLAAA